MAIRVSQYLPPGVYIQEEVVKPIPAFVGLPRQVCIIGEGDPCATISNEHHLRAFVTEEAVTPSSGGVFVTSKQSDLKKSSMFLFKNTDQQNPDIFSIEELLPSALTGTLAGLGIGNVNNGTHSYKVTFVINGDETAGGAVSNTVTVIDLSTNGQVALTAIPVGPTGTTARKVYRSAAGDAVTGPWKLLTTIANNTATTFTDNVADGSLGATLSIASTGLTLVTIAATAFDATADYTFSYQALAALYDSDELSENINGDCGDLLFVGSFQGTKNFVEDADYEIDKPNNAIVWLAPTAAVTTGSETETYDFSAGLNFKITVDGGAEQSVSFSTTPGEDFVDPTAATAAEVATVIDTISGLSAADNGSGQVEITSDTTGPDSSLTIGAGTANSVLGFQTGALSTGTGKNPSEGEEYFVTYKAERPDTDFNRPILSTSFDQLIAKVGALSSTNALALGGQIVFEQNPPFVYHIQVKNTGTGIAAQDIDYQEAIAGAELNPDLTDIIVLSFPNANAGGAKPLVRQALREHVTDESGLKAQAERMAWFGMPVGTVPGDGETAGTFVYVATQELQVDADSPGRGRFVLNGPSFIKKTYRLPDGTAKQFTLDSTYLAAGVAALNASFLSPADGLLRKEVVGLDEVEEISVGDRDFMAANGVNLVTARAGRNIVFDPQSTDQSSAEFREINVMNQKDNIVKRVRTATDDAIIGLVPDDLGQFIFELKSVIATQLTSAIADGAIAPFQNDDGSIRNIDLTNDIIVRRRASDPTSYDFRFAFYVKFIVKRLFGTFSVNIPSGV